MYIVTTTLWQKSDIVTISPFKFLPGHKEGLSFYDKKVILWLFCPDPKVVTITVFYFAPSTFKEHYNHMAGFWTLTFWCQFFAYSNIAALRTREGMRSYISLARFHTLSAISYRHSKGMPPFLFLMQSSRCLSQIYITMIHPKTHSMVQISCPLLA